MTGLIGVPNATIAKWKFCEKENGLKGNYYDIESVSEAPHYGFDLAMQTLNK